MFRIQYLFNLSADDLGPCPVSPPENFDFLHLFFLFCQISKKGKIKKATVKKNVYMLHSVYKECPSLVLHPDQLL
jgi:hypothetical protein